MRGLSTKFATRLTKLKSDLRRGRPSHRSDEPRKRQAFCQGRAWFFQGSGKFERKSQYEIKPQGKELAFK